MANQWKVEFGEDDPYIHLYIEVKEKSDPVHIRLHTTKFRDFLKHAIKGEIFWAAMNLPMSPSSIIKLYLNRASLIDIAKRYGL